MIMYIDNLINIMFLVLNSTTLSKNDGLFEFGMKMAEFIYKYPLSLYVFYG